MPRIKSHWVPLLLATMCSVYPASTLADTKIPIVRTSEQTVGQTRFTANELRGKIAVELEARGNVVVTRDDQTVQSDWLNYHQEKERIKAGERFKVMRGLDMVIGTTLDYDIAKHHGTGMNPEFTIGNTILPDKEIQTAPSSLRTVAIQGDGQQVDFCGQKKYRVHHSRINSCLPGDASWHLHSSLLDLDYTNGVGVAYNARLFFYGVPLLYTPWIDFPLNGNRKSGVLPPRFNSGSNGTEIALSYYWDIAPNHDATITSHFNNKHGTLLSAELRYLQPGYSGSLETEQLFRDKATKSYRHAWHAKHEQTLAPGLTLGYNANLVSDASYFKDFRDPLSVAANVYPAVDAWVNYDCEWQSGAANATWRLQRYQTLLDTPSPEDIPYEKLPQLTFTANQQLPQGFSANLQGELTRFSHPILQTGARLVAYPSLTWELNKSWGFLRPKFGLYLTEYNLNALIPEQSRRSMSGTRPIFSTDAGLYFDRDTELLGRRYILTLEPRLFYVNIPGINQNYLPHFDTSENDSNFAQLFTENRFAGLDRINGANHLTTALASRLINQANGLEQMRVMVGQRQHIKQNEITLPGTSEPRTDGSSNLLLEVRGDLNQGWSLDSAYEWNDTLQTTERYYAQLRYNPSPGKALNTRYRYSRNEPLNDRALYGCLNQIDIGAQWPLTQKWYALGRYNYSLDSKKILEKLVGFEYNSGCWSTRLVGHRYVSDLTTTKNAIYFQLEFKGLGSVDSNLVKLLKLAIPGYSNPTES